MTEYTNDVKARDEELKREEMESMWTNIYAQWNKNDPGYEDYIETNYANGRTVKVIFGDESKPNITWGRERERFWRFWSKLPQGFRFKF